LIAVLRHCAVAMSSSAITHDLESTWLGEHRRLATLSILVSTRRRCGTLW